MAKKYLTGTRRDISGKNNYVFDFENHEYSIPLDDSKISRKINYREYVTAYTSIAGAQVFDPKKTIYRCLRGEFFFDVFFEQPSLGLLFIKENGEYPDDYIEKLQIYCDVYKIKLGLVYLNSEIQLDDIYVSNDGLIYAYISGKEHIDELDDKIKKLMKELLAVYFPKLYRYKDELYSKLDKELCRKLAVLLSMK